MRETLARLVGDALLPERGNAAWSVRGVVPRAVVQPAATEQAAAVLSACSEHGWTVECAGAGGWLRQGRTPARVDVLLSSGRMRGLTEYNPDDVTLGVRAGTPITELRNETAKHRQSAVLDAPAAAGATVGAMLAAGVAGPLRASVGTPRDQALGIEIVTGDGRVLRFGGRVVKNVAGYDIVRLLVGSHGTLGFITAAHLRLRALPESEVRLCVENDAPEPLADAALQLAPLEPAFLEIIVTGPADSRLIAGFRGNAAAVEEAAQRALERTTGLRRLAHQEDPFDAVREAERAARVTVVLRGPSTRLADTLATARTLARDAGMGGATVAAHAMDGIVRVFGEGGEGMRERFAEALDAARRTCRVSVPVPPPGVDDIEPWMVKATPLVIMRRLRAAFDPAGVLAPGRFVL